MLNFLTGDATRPIGPGQKYIVHIVNSVGGWGAGFVVAISRRWKSPETAYRQWYRTGMHDNVPFELGRVQFVKVEEDIVVGNMIAQAGYGYGNANQHRSSAPDGTPPIRYNALRECLFSVGVATRHIGASIHMPRIGCGLAGGSWDQVEPIIESTLSGLDVFVYDLPMRLVA